MDINLKTVESKIAEYLNKNISLLELQNWSFNCIMGEGIDYDLKDKNLTTRIVSLIDDESLKEKDLQLYLQKIVRILDSTNSFELKENEILIFLDGLRKNYNAS